ncbi:hypothetical protein X797_011136 [Metarhizium robertsii]|uniref:Uncharacterized protein n=1 Tax=Metarhizium robertsii TaxID=568076 RepID=A0A014N7P3_9HYPO|nr:hypothetical protein X797_011136 [Metarhizium robertsii]
MQEKLLANLSSNSLTDEEQSSRWKDFYNHWHSIINSPTEAAFNERVKAFEDKYVNNHVEEVAYIKEVWLAPYKERLVKAWTQSPLDISGSLYNVVRGWVSFEALRKVDEQRKLVNAENSPLSRPCTGRFTASYGLPCVHRLKALMDAKLPVALNEFHRHWHFKRDGEPIHLAEPRRLKRYRKEDSKATQSSTKREECAFKAVERRRQPSKCSACGVVGHTRVSRLCSMRYEYLQSSSINNDPQRESSPSDELLIASQLSATADTVHDTVRAPEAIVTRVTKPARRDSPEAIYQAYLQAREKWYSTQSDGRKTDKSYREASKLPHSYSKAQYKWCENWKEMGQFCTSSGAMRRWTREEKMAYIDWSYAEDQRVEAIVAAEMANDTRETTRRGVDAIYDLMERDDLEQDALFEASIGAA